jgi:hypothetical protein
MGSVYVKVKWMTVFAFPCCWTEYREYATDIEILMAIGVARPLLRDFTAGKMDDVLAWTVWSAAT